MKKRRRRKKTKKKGRGREGGKDFDDFVNFMMCCKDDFVNPISDSEKLLLNKSFTKEELESVSIQIKDRLKSSPSLDCLTFHLYFPLKDILAPFLLKLLNFILTNNFCPFSFQESVIKLLSKPFEGGISSTKDFKTISLSNCDFKIF